MRGGVFGGAGWSGVEYFETAIFGNPDTVRGGVRGGVFGPLGWSGVESTTRFRMADEHPYPSPRVMPHSADILVGFGTRKCIQCHVKSYPKRSKVRRNFSKSCSVVAFEVGSPPELVRTKL